jgi:lipid A disaccharide synthetase
MILSDCLTCLLPEEHPFYERVFNKFKELDVLDLPT